MHIAGSHAAASSIFPCRGWGYSLLEARFRRRVLEHEIRSGLCSAGPCRHGLLDPKASGACRRYLTAVPPGPDRSRVPASELSVLAARLLPGRTQPPRRPSAVRGQGCLLSPEAVRGERIQRGDCRPDVLADGQRAPVQHRHEFRVVPSRPTAFIGVLIVMCVDNCWLWPKATWMFPRYCR